MITTALTVAATPLEASGPGEASAGKSNFKVAPNTTTKKEERRRKSNNNFEKLMSAASTHGNARLSPTKQPSQAPANNTV